MIKTILIKEFYSVFTNRRNFGVNGALHDAVSFAEDEEWRRIRTALSPSFTSGRLKEMFPIMKKYCDTLVKSMQRKAERDEAVEMKESFGAYSMDVVTSTALSVDIDSLNNPKDPFVTNIKKMFKLDFFNPLFLIVAFFPFMAPLLEKLNFSLFPSSVTDFFYASLRKIKAERKTKNRVDLLQLMVDSQIPENGSAKNDNESLKDHEILSQSMMFIFAGYEASNIMEKLQNEIDKVFPNKVTKCFFLH
uniref:Cytochrome P450 3A n=1 Tax=Scleropages formosus TaxID=113540 RepID=A0A8C9RCL9_SCLFO